MERSSALIGLIFLLISISCLINPISAAASGSGEGYSIAGRVKLDNFVTKGFGLGHSPKLSETKVILNGGQRTTFVRPDGYFSFHDVPAGTHLIEVSSISYLFSPVRVDISARNPGKIQAALTENRRALNELVLEPMKDEQYYEIREPFSMLSLVKSPMGLMIGFMVLVMFVFPKMMDGVDPEEMRQAQEQMREHGIPSISNLVAGRS
ncbi:Er membrane protein complex subunit 7-like protein [Rhynchospora pubera]|uniref:Er membrane protein complex subunit 7-like protein n=1 Tax=Rhynchospora pubera TaxID=906938 RepID=A0AAV8CVF5_9POAL|nr:Er membrane protein complex subunit 7-like protein [Rhynchospora pubera]